MTRRLRLTDRDCDLLVTLFGHRVMTTCQVVQLGFFGSLIRANARLRQLRDAGYLQRQPLPVSASSVLHRCRPFSAAILAQSTDVDEAEIRRMLRRQDSLFQLEHSLAVTEFRIACELSARQDGLPSARWTSEPLCRHEYSVPRGSGWERRIVKPDGLLTIDRDGLVRHFFVEVDRGHVSSAKFAQKVASYRRYQIEAFPMTYDHEEFTVLVVTTGRRRLHHLARLVKFAAPPILLTTYADVLDLGIYKPIWQVATSGARVGLKESWQ